MKRAIVASVVLLALLVAGAIVVGTGTLGSVSANCQVAGILAGGHRCTFTNVGSLLPGKGCVKVILKKSHWEGGSMTGSMKEDRLVSTPTCSGLVWGSSSSTSPVSFGTDPQTFCGTLKDCEMVILSLAAGES
jgi:hypothetical protein